MWLVLLLPTTDLFWFGRPTKRVKKMFYWTCPALWISLKHFEKKLIRENTLEDYNIDYILRIIYFWGKQNQKSFLDI